MSQLHRLGQVKAILFDLDGTLIEADGAAMEVVLARFPGGRSLGTLLRRAMFLAEDAAHWAVILLDRLKMDDEAFRLMEFLRSVVPANDAHRPALIQGVRELLSGLGVYYRLGLVTTRSRSRALRILQHIGLDEHFQVIVSRDDTARLKPSPEPVLYAAPALAVAPGECLMVGDTWVDVASAREAGAYAVAVLCGFGESRELAGADLVLDTTGDLGPVLLGDNGLARDYS
ncbi:MAG: HAD-IA family hydrolase [Chloroflexota bacterium]